MWSTTFDARNWPARFGGRGDLSRRPYPYRAYLAALVSRRHRYHSDYRRSLLLGRLLAGGNFVFEKELLP